LTRPFLPSDDSIFTGIPVWRGPPRAATFYGNNFPEINPGTKLHARGGKMRFGPFLGIAILLLILWLGGFLMFHVASGLIHLLLLFAIISLVIHFVTGSTAS
jgi:Family of unknown function (DUF5670)